MLRRFLLTVTAGALAFALVAPTTPNTASAAAAGGTRTTSASLARKLPEMKFDGVAFSDCVDFLRDVTAANIVVNWRALEAAGVTRETLVNLKVRNVSLRKALTLLLAEAGGGDAGVTYMLDDGVIEITTTELANQRVYTRVYPVGDLLMEIPNFEAPRFSLENNNASGGGRGGGGGGGGSSGGLFEGGGGGSSSDRSDSEQTKTRAEREEELLSLIRDTIYPDLWRENGGTASIRLYRDNLVVTAPLMVHEAIGGTWD
jgi:hypothetical protein